MIFKDKLPADWNLTLNTAGCFVVCGKEFLMLKRNDKKSHPGRWQLPGGKIEKGESELDGIKREVLEETGLDIPEEKFKFLDTAFVRYENRYDFSYHMFKVNFEEKPKIVIHENEHVAYDWFTLEKAFSVPLIEDQDSAINHVIKDLEPMLYK